MTTRPCASNALAVVVVELVAVAVPLVDHVDAVGLAGQAVGRQHAGPGAQPHRAAPLADDASARPSGRSPGAAVVLSNSVLLASSSPSTLAGELDRRRTACPGRCRRTGSAASGRSGSPRSCPRCRACRTRRARGCRRRPPRIASAPRPLDLLGLDPRTSDARPVGDPGVVERLVDRLVGVAVLHVLADDGDPSPRASGCMIRSSSSRQSPMSSGSAFRPSRLTMSSSSPLSTRLSGTS